MGWTEPTSSGRIRAGFRKPSGGKQHRTFDYQFEAEAWLEQVEGRLCAVDADATQLTGRAAPPRPAATFGQRVPPLGEYAQSWLRRCAAREITAATRSSYAREVRRLQLSAMRDMRMDTIGKRHVEDWLADLAEAAVGKPTRRAHLKVLRMVLCDAVDNDLVRRDPSAKIPLPKLGKSPARPLADSGAEDARLLLAAKPDPRAGVFILVALDAGLRWSEIAGLTWQSVDLDAGIITVWQIVERTTGLLRGFPKSHEPRRVVIGTDRLDAALRPLVAAAAERGGNGLLFTTATGVQLDYWNWARDFWYPARDGADLAAPQPRFHDLRHTHITRLSRHNVPVREIGTQAGHADEHITATYIHEDDERNRVGLIRRALAAYA